MPRLILEQKKPQWNMIPNKLQLQELEKMVEDTGYAVVNEKVTIKVGGMTCAMCVQAIEGVLRKIDGISEVNVNLAAEKAYVTYNPQMTSVSEMKEAIEDLGYEYLGLEGEIPGDQEEKLRKADLNGKRNRFIVAFAVSIPMMILMYSGVMLPFNMAYFMLVGYHSTIYLCELPYFLCGLSFPSKPCS